MAGAAYCWGIERSLGIGLSDTITHSSPAPVVGGLTFQSVSAAGHTCGVTTAGVAYCWGSNFQGSLGVGSLDGDSLATAPVPVVGGLSFQSVSGGGSHACGVTTSGAAYCWGRNSEGQLGATTTETCAAGSCSTAPIAVSGGLTFASLSAGSSHTCGLTTGGDTYCWGFNGGGQLGDGTTISRSSPTPVTGGLTFASVSVGEITCGVATDGTAYCWGGGRLGDGSSSMSSSPVAVAGGLTFGSVSAGGAHTCGITTSSEAYCWGHNWDGTLGNGGMADGLVPVRVFGQGGG